MASNMPTNFFRFRLIFFFALVALLLHAPSCRSETEYHIDPVMGSDLNSGTSGSPFQSLNAICGRTPSELNTVIFDSVNTINLSQNCQIRGVWVFRCQMTCGLKFNTTVASLVVEAHNGAGSLKIDGLSVYSEGGATPTITLRQTDLVLRDSRLSLVRPFVVVDATSSMVSEASEYSFNTNSDSGFYGFLSNGGKFNFTSSVFKGITMMYGPIIRLERGSLLHLDDVTFDDIRMTPPSSLNPAKLISSSFSDIQLLNSTLQNIFYTQDSIDIVHPNLISAEHGHTTIKNTYFSAITLDCVSSSQCRLGSIISLLNDSSYLIETSTFHSTTSKGCTNLHLVESSGRLIGNTFYNVTLNGRADRDTSRGLFYPPKSYPNIQGSVCLTRRLENLQADFGSQLAPLGTSFTHHIYRNTWDTIKFPDYGSNPMIRRDIFGTGNRFLLYGSDLWASNVALEISNDNIFSSHDHGQVRFDACKVNFESAVPVFRGLNGLIDFGSSITFKTPITLFEVRNLAIYGITPTGPSKYEFDSPGSLHINSHDTAIVTGGIFHNVWMRVINGTSQAWTLGRSYPEAVMLQPPVSQPWPDIFSMTGQSGVETQIGTLTNLQTVTTPLVISSEGSNAFVHGGLMRATKQSSPYAIGGPRPATVKTAQFVAASSSNVEIFDLCIEGDMTLEGSASLVPSMARNVFHGLNVTGTLRRSNPPFSLNPNYGQALNALNTDSESLRLPQRGQANRIPIVIASAIDPPGFLVQSSLNFVNMVLRVKETETGISPQRISVEIEKVSITFQPRRDTAGFIGKFHLKDIRWMDHTITANCSNLFVTLVLGMQCQWMSDSQILIWSDDVVLPENIVDLGITTRWKANWNPQPFDQDGPVFVPPTALMMALPSRIRSDATFWLDLSPSYHLVKSGSTPTVSWSIVGPVSQPLADLMTLNGNSWRWQVPASLLVVDISYRFSACIQGTRSIGPLCTSATLTTYNSIEPQCDPPAIFLDTPAVWNVYESARNLLRVIVDPACSAQNITGLTRFTHTTSFWFGLPSTLVPTEEAVPDATAYGTQFDFNVTAIFGNGKSSWASTKVVLRSVQPLVKPNFMYEVDSQISPSLEFAQVGFFSRDLPLRVRWGNGVDYKGIICPLNSWEYFFPKHDPVPTYLPPFINDSPCFNDKTSPPLAYYPDYASLNLSSYPMTLGNTSTWKLGEYLLPATLNFTRTDQQYLSTLKIPIKLVESSTDVIDMAVLSMPEKRALLASHSVVFGATKKDGIFCTDCTYLWSANNGALTSTQSLLRIPYGTFGQLQDIPVTLSTTFPSGIVSTSRRIYKTSSLPFGGSFDVTQTAPGVFDMEALHWSTDYPPLQYQVLQSDCGGINKGQLVIATTYTHFWKNVKPPVHGCPTTLTLFVTDGVGAIAHKSVSIPSFTPTYPQWTTQSLIDFSANLTRLVRAGFVEEAFELTTRMPTIKDAPKVEWQAARTQFVEPFATTVLTSTTSAYDWTYLMSSLFPDLDTLKTLGDNRIMIHLLRTIIAHAPYYSAWHAALWSARFRLIDDSFGALFGTDLRSEIRSANIEVWFSTSLTPGGRALMPLMLHFRGEDSFPFASEGNFVSLEWSPLHTASFLSTASVSHRIGSVVAKLDMTKYAGEPSLYLLYKTFKNRTHPLMSVDPFLTPIPMVKSLLVLPVKNSLSIPLTFDFEVPSNIATAHPDLICVSTTGYAWETQGCTTRKEGLTYYCDCNRKLNPALDVTLINPAALCPQPIPSDSAFRCINGQWTLIGDAETPIITIPTGSSVVIVGNLTTETIIFNGLSAVINITGCTKIGTSINIELTQEELDRLLKTGVISSLLIISSGCDISELEQVQVVTTSPGNRCEKVVSNTKATPSTLSAVLSIDKKSCKKSTWWIVLVSVFGGVVVLAIAITLLAMFTPLKYIIRPYARRAEQANIYYYDDGSSAKLTEISDGSHQTSIASMEK